MKFPRSALLALSLALALPAAAQSGEAPRGSPAAQSKDGFSGIVVVTDDANWQERLRTAQKGQMALREAGVVHLGGKVFVLILYSGLGVDQLGEANVECALEIRRPDGAISQKQDFMSCAKGRLKGDPSLGRVAPLKGGFLGEAGDLEGVYPIVVHLRDKVRNVELELKSSFTYRKKP